MLKAAIANLPGLKVTDQENQTYPNGRARRADCRAWTWTSSTTGGERDAQSIDLFLEDSNGNQYPVWADRTEEWVTDFRRKTAQVRRTEALLPGRLAKLKRTLSGQITVIVTGRIPRRLPLGEPSAPAADKLRCAASQIKHGSRFRL